MNANFLLSGTHAGAVSRWRHATSTAAAPRPQPRCRVAVWAWNRQGPTIVVPTTPPPEPPSRPGISLPIVLGLAAAAAVLVWQRQRQDNSNGSTVSNGMSAMLMQPGQVRLHQSEAEAKEYKMALARTRQATAVHRAIGFMKAGSSTRAMVELRRALHENSICRSPLLNTNHTKKDLELLYRLHLQNVENPSDFATLLQLRSMLDLGFDEAERIEAEVMQQGAAYSI